MPAIERPDTGNYFRFYGIDPVFAIDAGRLKTLFLEKSRQFHPDFYTLDPEAQNVALAVSAYNNQAYKTLNNEISRAQYLVELNLPQEDAKPQLPNTFLMEMMDLNEAVDELGFERNAEREKQLDAEIAAVKGDILNEIRAKAGAGQWPEAQIAVLKWKYLERLQARMNSLG